MADQAHVEALLQGVPDTNVRRLFVEIFRSVLRDIRFGRAEDTEASKNFGGGFFRVKTPSVANTEFTIAHSFGRKPYLVMPVLPLDQVGAKVVRLEVTKPADAIRIYLRSPETDAVIFLYLEG